LAPGWRSQFGGWRPIPLYLISSLFVWFRFHGYGDKAVCRSSQLLLLSDSSGSSLVISSFNNQKIFRLFWIGAKCVGRFVVWSRLVSWNGNEAKSVLTFDWIECSQVDSIAVWESMCGIEFGFGGSGPIKHCSTRWFECNNSDRRQKQNATATIPSAIQPLAVCGSLTARLGSVLPCVRQFQQRRRRTGSTSSDQCG